MREIYLDNAASSKIKPNVVTKAMVNYLKEIGCSPGRGGYECSLKAGRILFETRIVLKEFFNAPSAEQIIFTHNITHSLNYALKGILKNSDHVITTSMEHNSVIRPLKKLEKTREIQINYIKCNQKGNINPLWVEKAIRSNTKLIVITHASNVTGTIMPVAEIAGIAKKNGLLVVLDTAQTAGAYPLDFQELNLDILCFTGHKGLMGPTGTGGFVISKKAADIMEPLIEGGTGSISDCEYQPEFLPDKFESGTMNTVGIAGLNAALGYINKIGIADIRKKETELTHTFLEGLKEMKEVVICGPADSRYQTSTVSINLKGHDIGEISFHLDNKYGIMTRSGLHCAPMAHKTIGTFPAGTLRFSFGYYNTFEEINYTLKALGEIIKACT